MAQLMTKKGLYLMIQPLSDENASLERLKAEIRGILPTCPENEEYLGRLCAPASLPAVQYQRLTALGCFLSLLREVLPQALPSLRLYRDEFGRPFARCEEASVPPFDFNLTHARHYAGCGLLTGGGRVGVDIEEALPEEKAKKIAVRFFTEKELRHLQGLDREAFSREAAYLWTAKEALSKQAGKGFPLGYDSLSCPGELSLLQGILGGEDACPASVLTVCVPADAPFPVCPSSCAPVLWRNFNQP